MTKVVGSAGISLRSLSISRRALAIVRQNIGLAIGLKAIFLVLAALGQATLWMAVAADMGASLLVIANGLRAIQAVPSSEFRVPR